MAFTEHTFSLLRESVKQSMLDDKQKGLPTGELLEFKLDTLDIVHYINYMFSDVRYYDYDDTRAEADRWVENSTLPRFTSSLSTTPRARHCFWKISVSPKTT